MRILHTESSRGWGGQEIRILTEIAELRRRGHQVWLACAPDSELAQRVKDSDLSVIHLPFAYNGDIDTISGLCRLVRQHQLDVVNTHSSIDSWCAALASLVWPRVLLVRTRHLSNPIRGNLPTRWLYRRPHAVTTTGEALRQQVIAQAGARPERLLSVPTGIDVARFDPAQHDGRALRATWGVAEHEPLIGTIAMLRGWKGHRYLVEAAPAILAQHPHARFVFVGHTTDAHNTAAATLRAQMEHLGVAERFIFAGYHQDVPAVLAALNMVVLPSTKNEGVPQSLTQALCMAKPVVATDVGSVGELIIDRRTGRLVPPSNSAALAEAVNELLAQPELAVRYAQTGRQHALTNYSLGGMVTTTERLYERLQRGEPAYLPR